MTIEITMPAQSPTMEEGTLVRWLEKSLPVTGQPSE